VDSSITTNGASSNVNFTARPNLCDALLIAERVPVLGALLCMSSAAYRLGLAVKLTLEEAPLVVIMLSTSRVI